MSSTRKQRQQKLLAGLVIACTIMGAALAYILWSEMRQTATGLDKSAISNITLTQTSGQSVSLRLQDGKWHISEPEKQPANPARVEPLLSIATIPPSYASTEVDRDAAGLNSPIASISFNDKQFNIGELDVSGKRRYAEHDGQVYFFPEWISSFIDSGVATLVMGPTK